MPILLATRHRTLGPVVVFMTIMWLATVAPARAQTESVEYYGLDALGSVRVVFDPTGAIVGRMDYGPFGEELSNGAGLPSRAYAGLFRDGESGLDHAQARSYQTRTGRFSTVDPVYAGLFDPQEWNRYAYALNNPAVFIDPSGRMAQGPKGTCGNSGFAAEERSFCDIQLAMEFTGFGYGGRQSGGGRSGRGTTQPNLPPKNEPTQNEPPKTDPPTTPPTTPPTPTPTPTNTPSCYQKWQFSGLFPEGPGRTAVQLLEFGSVTSLISDIGATAAKLDHGPLLGSSNRYGSGLNRAFRSVVTGSTRGGLTAVGDTATPVFAVTAVFTMAYNSTIAVQCGVGTLD